ncbi:hypothetical protein WJX73_006788 [Symbiochloris irregularis]|uniref:OCRE domain-containing protein n=1 Tax=Symbiochloris irregularis TaxID=706552 RepID=A0AAW1P9I7_9CHLO
MNTQAIIDAALKQEKAEKQNKKLGGQPKAKRKGVTDEQLEEAEGGTVRENLVGKASKKRARTRKGTAADTDLVENVEEAEEQLQEESEDVALEPFNLVQERQEGHFDEGGNYVEGKADEEDNDAWLTSDAGIVSQAARKKIAERQRQQEAEEAKPELSGAQAAEVKRSMAAIMLPKETVSRAMNRLRPPASKGKAPKHKTEAAASASGAAAAAEAEQYQKLKAGADALMDSGEMDVYGLSREDLERGAALFAPAALPGADDDDEDDMFADPESAPKGPTAVQESSQVDYSSWPIKELRRFLQERGQDAAGIVDKSDLVAKVKEVASRGPEGADDPALQVPQGYSYDAGTGYYYSPESSLYYDASSGGFYSSQAQKWYAFNAESGEFAEWAQSGQPS